MGNWLLRMLLLSFRGGFELSNPSISSNGSRKSDRRLDVLVFRWFLIIVAASAVESERSRRLSTATLNQIVHEP
ncbi:hypothetical protein LXL04_029948 [Taraxacum kok-saghyz]